MQTLIVERYAEILKRVVNIIDEPQICKTIFTALNFHDALYIIKNNKPDAVVIDLCLPGNEAYDLIKEIKATANDTLVIMLSIFNDNHTKEKCRSLGADYFFDKYYDFEKLPDVLKERKELMMNGIK